MELQRVPATIRSTRSSSTVHLDNRCMRLAMIHVEPGWEMRNASRPPDR